MPRPSSSLAAWRPRISAAIVVIVVLTLTSTCIIVVTFRQHALMRQRVRFFRLIDVLEESVGELHRIADAGGARRDGIPAAAARADQQLRTLLKDSDVFDTIQPRIVHELTHVQRAVSAAARPPSSALFAATNDAFDHLHAVQELAGDFYTERLERYGNVIGGMAALLGGACALLLILALVERRSERELARAGVRYAELFEQIRDAALITEYGCVVDINSAGLELFGYSRQAMIGMPLAKLVVDRADVGPFIDALRNGAVTDYELRLRTADGRAIDCLITAAARFDAEGVLIGCQGLARDVTDRKLMLEALRQSEREYRGLFEHAYDAIIVFDPVTEEILDANGQACILYDCPREELIGRSLETLTVDKEDGKRLLRKMSEDTGHYSSMESRQYRRDGTIIEVEINAAEVPYGGRTAILSINRDVTARRAAERAVRESEERFRLLLESVTDYAIFMLDPAGNIVSWNEGAQRITGYAADEILGWPTSTFYPADATAKAEEELRVAAAEGRAECEGWQIRKDGRRFHASVTLTRIVDENGALRGFSKVIRDTTELEQLEQTQQEMFSILQRVAGEWTQTFDAVQVPIVIVDDKGEIRRVNRAAEVMTGLTFPQLLRCRVDDIAGEPWQTIGRVARSAHDFEKPADSRAVDDSGSVWQVSSCVSRFPDAERLAIVVAYDLTLVTRLEESLRQTELAATLGNIVGGVAHEVRNPLFTISATLDACEARLGNVPHLGRYIRPLREEVNRLNNLMADLLEYGKPHPLVIQPAPLAGPIAAGISYCAAIADGRGVRIVTAIDAALPDIPIDAARLEQVFLNVVANAVQHSPEGGVVRVEAAAAGDVVVCTVTDDGPGLEADEVERVFVPFYTRRKGGTGLGLSITRKIVIAHGGEITVANRTDGHGALVTIRLPRLAVARAAGAPAEDASDERIGCG